jgi:hypothetical protein
LDRLIVKPAAISPAAGLIFLRSRQKRAFIESGAAIAVRSRSSARNPNTSLRLEREARNAGDP